MNPMNNDSFYFDIEAQFTTFNVTSTISTCQNDSLCFRLTKGAVQSQVVYIGHIVYLRSSVRIKSIIFPAAFE